MEALEGFELMDVFNLFAAFMGHPAAWIAIGLVVLWIVLNSEFARSYWRRRRNGNGD